MTVTEDGIARARARIGVERQSAHPDWAACNVDALYHYCQGLGDDNPLFWNEGYARQTHWGGVIAPPMFIRNIGTSRVEVLTRDGKPLTAEEREAGEHALSGLHVQVGEELPPIIKGPLTVSDMIAWNWGDGLTMIHGAHRLMFLNYARHPKAYPINEAGIPDVVERVHWDNSMGRRTGNPAAYDYGAQRVAWMAHLITDWIGDNGWMQQFSTQFRRFNYLGDTTWCKGKVVTKNPRDGEHRVKLELRSDDQRGRQTTIGKAVVQLPSQERPSKLHVITADWW